MRHITDMKHNITKETLKIIDNSVKNIKKAKALELLTNVSDAYEKITEAGRPNVWVKLNTNKLKQSNIK